jgi:hypothetical protein
MSFSKKFVSSFLRDSVSARPVSIVRLFESPVPQERVDVKVHHLPYETYTAINMNPYTLEEQLMMYPVVAPLNNMPLSAVVIHNPSRGYVAIDVE